MRQTKKPQIEELFKLDVSNIGAGAKTSEIFDSIIHRALHEFQFSLVEIWSVDPRREQLILIDRKSAKPLSSPTLYYLRIEESLTGEAVESRTPLVLNREQLFETRGGRKFANPELLKDINPVGLISIPILNLSNPHQVLAVVNFFLSQETETNGFALADFQTPFVQETIVRQAQLLAAEIEGNLRELAYRSASDVTRKLAGLERLTIPNACYALAETINKVLGIDWVTVYLEDWSHKQVKLRADYGCPALKSPARPDIPLQVQKAWELNREYLAHEPLPESMHSEMFEAEPIDKVQSVMFVPLHDVKGKSKGVVRCVNLLPESKAEFPSRAHSYDEVAVVEAMGQAFESPLEIMLAAETREISQQRLAHELRVPVVAFHAVINYMEREFNEKQYSFEYPHFSELNTYAEIMQRLLTEIETMRLGAERIQVRRRETNLLADIINPTRRFLRPLLTHRNMRPDQIRHSGFERLNKYKIDRALVTQIVFNLVENAVKYFPKPPRFPQSFDCLITPGTIYTNPRFLFIYVQDNGDGVKEEDRERIFEYGYRGVDAHQSDVLGSGLGLWLSRDLARLQGGDLTLSNPKKPTIFLLKIRVD